MVRRRRHACRFDPKTLVCGGASPVGPAFTDIAMDVDSAAERAMADPAASIAETSRWTNLNTFSGHGVKLIFFPGMSDAWFSPLDTVDYYERMISRRTAVRREFVAGAACCFPPGWGIAAEVRRRSILSVRCPPSCGGWSRMRRRRP